MEYPCFFKNGVCFNFPERYMLKEDKKTGHLEELNKFSENISEGISEDDGIFLENDPEISADSNMEELNPDVVDDHFDVIDIGDEDVIDFNNMDFFEEEYHSDESDSFFEPVDSIDQKKSAAINEPPAAERLVIHESKKDNITDKIKITSIEESDGSELEEEIFDIEGLVKQVDKLSEFQPRTLAKPAVPPAKTETASKPVKKQNVASEDFYSDDEIDFRIIHVEGYPGLSPDNFLDSISTKKPEVEVKKTENIKIESADAKQTKPAAEIKSNSGDDLVVLSVEELSDEEYAAKFKTSSLSEVKSEVKNQKSVIDNDGNDAIFIDLNSLMTDEEIENGIREINNNDADVIFEEVDKEFKSKSDSGKTEVIRIQKETFKDKIVIDIPDSVTNELPDDFQLEAIDLADAQKVANEDILLLNEEDLIRELDSIHLAPVSFMNDNPPLQKQTAEINYLGGTKEHVSEKAEDFIIENSESENISAVSDLVIENAMSEPEVELLDITSHVVILDDENVNSFVADNIDEGKQEDMKRLLSYLDGLFENLPEDLIKNFADSEYFDLYVKIMNDLGV